MRTRRAHSVWMFALSLALQVVGCASRQLPLDGGTSPQAREVAAALAGSFSSAEQAAADTAYFDIRLQMMPIWTDRTDGPWLYVEQAVSSRQDKPYRQRVYRIRPAANGNVESQVFTLPGPTRFAGAWRDPAPLAALTPDSLELRDGCSIFLRRSGDGHYEGGTLGTGCPSELRGASFATSIVTIEPAMLLSWDRGFDAQGKQVWGAEKGGYVFMKLEDWSSRLAPAPSSR